MLWGFVFFLKLLVFLQWHSQLLKFALQTPSLPAPVFVTYSLHRVGNNGVCSLRFEELQYSLNSRKGNYFQHNLSWF